MSGGLSDLRDAVVSTLQTLLPAAISVEPHGGTFDLEELKRIALTAPAVRIAVVGAHHDKRWKDGRWAVPVHLAAVIVTRDTVTAGAKLSRDAAALILSTAVQIAIAGNRFGLEGVYPPDGVDARNEYSGSVDKLGVALWQVTWSSTMLIGSPVQETADVVIANLTRAIVNGTDEWTPTGGIVGADFAAPDPVVAPPFEVEP